MVEPFSSGHSKVTSTFSSPDVSHRYQKGLLHIGRFFFKYRNGLFPFIWVLLMIGSAPLFYGKSLHSGAFNNLLGLSVALLGEGWRILVVGLVYIIRGGRNKKFYAESLVTEGIYAHTRNPMYLGNLLIILGGAILYNAPLFYVTAIPFYIFAYYTITWAEEEYLGSRFGREYEGYCRRVNRIFPSLIGLGDTIRSRQFNWKRVLSKEYSSFVSFFIIILGIFTWKHILLYGFHQSRPFFIHIGYLYLLSIAMLAIVKSIKKQGLLG